LKKSIELADDLADSYYDLAVVLNENNQSREAFKILEIGRSKSPIFAENTKLFHEYLKTAAEASLI
jgi:hypothetical protein